MHADKKSQNTRACWQTRFLFSWYDSAHLSVQPISQITDPYIHSQISFLFSFSHTQSQTSTILFLLDMTVRIYRCSASHRLLTHTHTPSPLQFHLIYTQTSFCSFFPRTQSQTSSDLFLLDMTVRTYRCSPSQRYQPTHALPDLFFSFFFHTHSPRPLSTDLFWLDITVRTCRCSALIDYWPTHTLYTTPNSRCVYIHPIVDAHLTDYWPTHTLHTYTQF